MNFAMSAPKRNHRPGFTLIEFMTLLPLMAAIMLLSVALAPVFLKTVPSDSRATQTHRQMLGMLQRIQQDMDAGIALPDVSTQADANADPQTLLIQTTAGLVCYKFKDNEVTRYLPPGDASAGLVWQFRDAVISWKKIVHGEGADAIEVRTAAISHAQGMDVEHLVNTHVYFLNALQSQLVRK